MVGQTCPLALSAYTNPELAKSPQELLPVLEEAAEERLWKSSVALGILARDGLGMLGYLIENGEDQPEFPAFGLELPGKDVHAGLLQPLNSETGEAPRSKPVN